MDSMWIKYRYPTLHWLTSLVIGPTLLLAYALFHSASGSSKDWLAEFLLLAFLMGAFLSIPTYAVYLGIFPWLFEKVRSAMVLKVICNIVVISCAGLTFFLIDGSAVLNLFGVYAIAVILSSMLVRVHPKLKPAAAPVG